MSREFDAKKSALAAYPDNRNSAIDLFITIVGCDMSDIEYEVGMSCEKYIFGDEKLEQES